MKGVTLTRDGTKSPEFHGPHGYREEGGQTARRSRQTPAASDGKECRPELRRTPTSKRVGVYGLRLRFTVKSLGGESGNETPRRQRLEKMGNRDGATCPPRHHPIRTGSHLVRVPRPGKTHRQHRRGSGVGGGGGRADRGDVMRRSQATGGDPAHSTSPFPPSPRLRSAKKKHTVRLQSAAGRARRRCAAKFYRH